MTLCPSYSRARGNICVLLIPRPKTMRPRTLSQTVTQDRSAVIGGRERPEFQHESAQSDGSGVGHVLLTGRGRPPERARRSPRLSKSVLARCRTEAGLVPVAA
jgi:hypothetical protein